MRIRSRLLILLLLIALVPVIAIAVLHRVSMHRLSGLIATRTRAQLREGAEMLLRDIVTRYSDTLSSQQRLLETAVRLQTREAEHLLADHQLSDIQPVLVEQFMDTDNPPPGLEASDKHTLPAKDGIRKPIMVSYEVPVIYLAPGTNRSDPLAKRDTTRMARMGADFAFIQQQHPAPILWQYVSLESGVHVSYPGKGIFPKGYDPRKRNWYTAAKQRDSITWTHLGDATTDEVVLTVSTPIRRPDGAFAGVTGIDLSFRVLFGQIHLPTAWRQEAEAIIVAPEMSRENRNPMRLIIMAHKRYKDKQVETPRRRELSHIGAEDPDAVKAILADIQNGKAGVREIQLRGKAQLCAYGVGDIIPIIVVPKARVMAQATASAQAILDANVRTLVLTGIISLALILIVVLISVRRAKTLTQPLSTLATAVRKLMEGDYGTRVDIRTGDEMQELGETFNEIGPKLHERESMKQALAVAMEIQQNLLPREAPRLAGFDIAGHSVYCDETGGDYYDFIELMDLGENKLGIAVGDVTGHGIAAALLMASARGVLRSHATLSDGDKLDKLFNVLNIHLVRDTDDTRFMTLFYGILDGAEQTLEWASAGHDPAIVCRTATGEFEELPNTGMPLGLIEEADFEQAGPAHFLPGDVIAIGTDGIWEARNEKKEMFGKDRLRKLIADHSSSSAQEIYEAVVASLTTFTSKHSQEDDVTLVIIKTT
jgi:phosphoserine phosphatase RsbU/P